ncbi:MAG: glycosyl hydrolase [Acidobacteriota bacterium]
MLHADHRSPTGRTSSALLLCFLAALLLALPTHARDDAKRGKAKDGASEKVDDGQLKASHLSALSLRSIGPALTSGRIGDLAVDPTDHDVWYVAVASGGVWKTINAGTTWTPIFDSQGSYSIGTVAIDPKRPHTIWVGTGENNSQRSVGYGDGLYRSRDGGKSWQKVGLETSEHIAKILIDPRDSDVVYVAAQGPLWIEGGERGLYKTVDGGETWEAVLTVDEHTGVTDVVIDPRDPDVLLAASHQRRRHVFTLLHGGPGSGLHKSMDGGKTWRKITSGLPGGDVGRIGLAVSPADPDVVYAVIEAGPKAQGTYRSDDFGESWRKTSGYNPSSPQYYQELFADPHDVDRVYSMDTFMHQTEDGGTTWTRVPLTWQHVDSHAMWIDPADADHLIVGNDGGLYETFDRGQTWRYFANLPVTQFYKLAIDDQVPFYNVYGGTQDNFTLGGPSRTPSVNGIQNRDWFVVVGGDGFQPAIEPGNADIVYGQWQYGNLVRFDRSTGDTIDIKPRPEVGEDPQRWNWDAPLVISPHDPKRLYFGSQRMYRSDDRGDSWTPISGDLTRALDRNKLEVMGRVWSIDAIAKNRSTSIYGNLVAFDESPRVEGLLYAGSDDGLIHVRAPEASGADGWRKIESVPGVPARTYVQELTASRHADDVVYAAFNHHKYGDFTPYLYKSSDRGATWTSIASDLPERGSVYAIAEDHETPGLLFVGTEFGLFVTLDDGGHWLPLSNGLPTIAVRDLAVHREMDDLVLGTFGRGFYVLDDYGPLRELAARETAMDAPESAMLFATRDIPMYLEWAPIGMSGRSFQGHGHYMAPNPPSGAVFTYYLPETLMTRKAKRQKAEREAWDAGENLSYPSLDALRAEQAEEAPMVYVQISDADGQPVHRLSGPTREGTHRIDWDLRRLSASPTQLEPWSSDNPFVQPPIGPLVVPGTYQATLHQWVDGETTQLAGPITFDAQPIRRGHLSATDLAGVRDFQAKAARLQRAVEGALALRGWLGERLTYVKRAAFEAVAVPGSVAEEARALEARLRDVDNALWGDRTRARAQMATAPGIASRLNQVIYGQWASTAAPTDSHRRDYAIAAEAFAPVLADLQRIAEEELPRLERALEDAGAPYTPGRVPRWQPE